MVLGAKRLSSSQTCFLEGRAHGFDSLPDPETPRQFRGSVWSKGAGQGERRVKEGRNKEKILTETQNGTGVTAVIWQSSLQNLTVEFKLYIFNMFLLFQTPFTSISIFHNAQQLFCFFFLFVLFDKSCLRVFSHLIVRQTWNPC